MKLHRILIAIALFSIFGNGLAESKKYFTTGSIAFEIGIWKPSNIDHYPSKPFTHVDGAEPMVGVTLTSPSLWGFALQLSALQWKQGNLIEQTAFESILMRHFVVDIKHQLISQSRISPYVAYGATLIWSRQNEPVGTQNSAAFEWSGLGANISAGVDFALFRHWGVAAEYQYIYAEFDNKIGLTYNYSGPKLTCKLLLTF
ncbi:hypothetical protein JXO59_16245 [candidate division KSB1 bacterium]|nr:hypothetical protein [candidate division KSB1 bacterium]